MCFYPKQDIELMDLLLRIKVLHPKILIPHKNVVIGCNKVRVQKAIRIPPWLKFKDFKWKFNITSLSKIPYNLLD